MSTQRHLPSPTQIVGAAELAQMLGIGRPGATELIRANAPGGRTLARAKDLLIEKHDAERLARAGLADTDQPALEVKVRAATWDPDEGRWLGWHSALTNEDADAAAGRWWSVREAESLVGGALVATIAGIVVRLRKISGVETWRTLRSFALEQPTAKQISAYGRQPGDRRIPIEPGPMVKRHGYS